ncbi:TPA: hypothetical protein ACGFAM_003343 [Klebsiella pneumoniae]|uniref:hypothetical protein n=1 Tax=Klebsiella pneumoniae complex TaxID=3390273 RepID=UPI000E2C1DBF|nr:hypothetical protein [Klebsiella pneumoniae]SWX04071.1 Uncharacterised protein [Klebsiella pneumoniae]HDW3839456.1 hypothetical protein [Raoultella ornithinolytica]
MDENDNKNKNNPMFDIEFGMDLEFNNNTTTSERFLKGKSIERLKAEGNKAGVTYELPKEISSLTLTPSQIEEIKEIINKKEDNQPILEKWLEDSATLATLASDIKISVICGIISAVKSGYTYLTRKS